MTIPLRLQPVVQSLKILLQLLPIVLLGDTIHTDRGLPAQSSVGACQSWHIDEMGQGVKLPFGFPFRSFRYRQKFR